MTEFYQFAADNWLMFGAWILVAFILLGVQLRLTATGPKAITSQTLTHLVNRENGVVIDIRGAGDYNKGHIQGALNIPMSKVKDSHADLEKYQDSPIILVCANGIQVNAACSILKKAGFDNLYKLSGGMTSWKGENLPVVKS
ncbi:rhodanese-like domain-containing protein [Aliikangiella sp. IMCC44653]